MEQQTKVELNPVTLLTLPPEIQSKIFSHLAVCFGRSTIQAVLRTCKQLYEVALPISVSIFRNTVNYPNGQGLCSPVRNLQFLRYILVSKPWLVKHVKTIIMGRISTNPEDWAQGQTTKEELSIYRQHMEFILGQLPSAYSNSWYAHWVEDLESGTSDAQFALILLTCPNIQTLLFEGSQMTRHFRLLLSFVRNLITINSLIQTPGSEWGDGNGNYPKMVIPLSNVQDIFHETMDATNGYPNYNFEALNIFTFPRLRFYECILAPGNYMTASNFNRLPHRSSPIEEIRLHCSSFSRDALQSVLDTCKALRKFEFTYSKLDIFPELMMPQDILHAILPHAATLEDLYLNFGEDELDKNWNWHDCPEKLYMGTELQRMSALRTLTLGMQALTGMLAFTPENQDATFQPNDPLQIPPKIEGAPRIIDCLPENLECLRVRDCGMAVLDQVGELINVVEQGHRFKKLNHIALMFNDWRMNLEIDQPVIDDFFLSITSNLHLEIRYRSEMGYIYDRGAPLALRESEPERNLMSRIYNQHIRTFYLKTRGIFNFTDDDIRFNDNPDLYDE